MSGDRILADTNVLLYLLNGDKGLLSIFKGTEVSISTITELELLSFPKLKKKEEKSIRDLVSRCTVINISDEIKELAIYFRRKFRLKLPDAVIAGTAHYHKLPILTADTDFAKLEQELVVILYKIEGID